MIQTSQPPSTASRHWWRPALVFHIYSVALAAILGTMVARAPLQPSDNLKFIGQAIHGSPLDVMRRHGQGKYRPAGLLAARAVTRVFNGHEAGAFRWLLGLQVAATGVLFGMALQVGTWYEVAAGTLALIVLFGHHAFRPTTLEGYPINHFGVVALCCLLALVLIQRPAAGWRSVAALAIALVAMFTLESGVLVVGVVGTGYLLGYRGVGLRGVALVLIALGVYLAARWWVLPADLRVPAFAGDRSGYGFAVLESDDIRMHFAGGAARIWWRVHNVAAAFLSVLFAEPREGQWSFVDAITRRRVTLAPAVEVLSSVSTTALVTTTMLAARRRRAADGEGPAAWRLCMLAVSIILASCDSLLELHQGRHSQHGGGLLCARDVCNGTERVDVVRRATQDAWNRRPHRGARGSRSALVPASQRPGV